MRHSLMLIIILLLLSSSSYSQVDSQDSTFQLFEKCMKEELSKVVKIDDTTTICFYGDRYNYKIELSYNTDASRLSLRHWPAEEDSARVPSTIFHRSYDYVDYVNMLRSQVSGGKCNVSVNEDYTYVFVISPVDSWIHCLSDAFLYSGTSSLLTTVDIISNKKGVIKQKRELYILGYSKDKGFKLREKILVEERVVCKK